MYIFFKTLWIFKLRKDKINYLLLRNKISNNLIYISIFIVFILLMRKNKLKVDDLLSGSFFAGYLLLVLTSIINFIFPNDKIIRKQKKDEEDQLKRKMHQQEQQNEAHLRDQKEVNLRRQQKLKEIKLKRQKEFFFLDNNKNNILNELYKVKSMHQLSKEKYPIMLVRPQSINKDNYKAYFKQSGLHTSNLYMKLISTYLNEFNILKDIKNIPLNYYKQNLDKMSGIEFEKAMVNHFKLIGYKVKRVGGANDYGVDIVISSPFKQIIQCKCYGEGRKVKSADL